MNRTDIYPIGQQDFKTLRQGGAVYVDKTRFVEKIVTSKSQYYFLARPRRFGKSLFLSTLKYFFEGEKELFEGLGIAAHNQEWTKLPVLHLDLNNGEYTNPENLDKWIGTLLDDWERKYNVASSDADISSRFYKVIKAAYEKTGQQVVILVDEYDKPLVKNLNKDNFEAYREKLTALYSNFKTCAEHIRLVFMTGVSRFSKLSVFSGLNNLNDITFDNDYADICGITEAELFSQLKPGIRLLADKYRLTFDEMRSLLKQNYDGYRFAEEGSDIYNPWSVLNCLSKKKIENYWNDTGIPTIIAESLVNINADLSEIFNSYCYESDLKGLDLLAPDPLALMYQTGYLTIKDFDLHSGIYRLGVPNREVEDGLVRVLLPYYARFKAGSEMTTIRRMVTSLNEGQPEAFLTAVQAYFAGVSYKMKMENENNFHNAFLLLTSFIGLKTQAEVNTSDGSIDMLIKTPRYVYVIELKYDRTASEAIAQIDRKKYDRMLQTDSRKIFRIGVSFSSKTRTIEDWTIG